VTLVNPNGLHLRPATVFAACARGFDGMVFVHAGERMADGKNHWDLLKLVAMPGTELVVEVSGPGAEGAIEPLIAILADPGEDE
jgi:phosphotransferase system HPr (HPr) family protein